MEFVKLTFEPRGYYTYSGGSNSEIFVLGMLLEEIGCSKNSHSSLQDWALADKNDPHCGMNPKDVSLIYAYTNEQIILTAYNSIIIDPVVWSSIAADPAAITVTTIFEQYTAPALSELQKQRLAEIKKILSSDVQAFFFRRQLAHVYHHFSTKKLFVLGFVGTLAAYVGILAAMSIVNINGIVAIGVGMVIGCIADLAFTYISNALFKLREEKAADLFAAYYSSRTEIEATATFFEQYQQIKDTFKDPSNFLSFLPSVLATGHLDSTARAEYLRNLAAKKEKINK